MHFDNYINKIILINNLLVKNLLLLLLFVVCWCLFVCVSLLLIFFFLKKKTLAHFSLTYAKPVYFKDPTPLIEELQKSETQNQASRVSPERIFLFSLSLLWF